MSTFVKGGGGAGEKVKIDGVKVANKMELTSYKGANPLTIGQAGVAFPANTLFLEDFDILNGVNGEDLTDTAADQTTAVTELMKMVNRKIAMNNGEGQYVWKKLTAEGGDFIDFVVSSDTGAYPDGGTQDGYWYELVEEGSNFGTDVWNKNVIISPTQYVTNPKITCTYAENDHVTTIRLHSSGFNFTYITDWKNFFNGFMRTADYGFKLSGSTLSLTGVGLGTGSWDQTVTLSNFTIVDATTVTFKTNKSCYLNGWTFTYTGQKMVKPIELECIGYVVSEDSSEYPNNAEHTDGFYYTLLAHVDSANVMRLSNGAYDVVETEVVNGIVNEVSEVSY